MLSFALDIMEIDGAPVAKRGKRSGSKQVYRCRACFKSVVVSAHKPLGRCECGGDTDPLLKPLIGGGRLLRDLPPPRTLRDYVLEQLDQVELSVESPGGLRGDY